MQGQPALPRTVQIREQIHLYDRSIAVQHPLLCVVEDSQEEAPQDMHMARPNNRWVGMEGDSLDNHHDRHRHGCILRAGTLGPGVHMPAVVVPGPLRR